MASKMSPWRALGLAVVVLVLAAAAAGCGGDEEEATSTSTSAAAEASSACGDGATQPSVDRIDVTVNGTARTALVHLPEAVVGTEPLPVVLSFHGASSSADVQQAVDGLTDKSDQEGFVVVHPEGLVVEVADQVTATGWDVAGREVDEPAFVTALLDELGAQVCIDPSRVYATGFSNGGELAMALPCALPDRIAAVAPVSGSYHSTECASDRAAPVMAFHGLDDVVVPIEGRRTRPISPPVVDVFVARAARNGCTGGPETQEVTSTVQSLTWTGCEAPTVLYQLEDHGHAWPGHPLPFTRDQVVSNFDTQPPNPVVVASGLTPQTMADNVLLTNVDIDATDLMWDFFTQTR